VLGQEETIEDSTDCPSSGEEGSVMRGRWRIIGMATRLSPRNSEVNALEQRGYLIGKKIGQVVHCSFLSFVCFNTSRSLISVSSAIAFFFSIYTVAILIHRLINLLIVF